MLERIDKISKEQVEFVTVLSNKDDFDSFFGTNLIHLA